MPGRIALASGFVQEPDALLGVIDEGFEQAGGCDIIMLVADIVGFAHGSDHTLVVFSQFREHVRWLDISGVIVGKALMARNVADRTQCRLADLAHALSDNVSGGENLVGLLIEQ